MAVVYTTELVTPAIAKAWLELCIENNRSTRPAKIEQFAADMRADLWEENGVTIKFDTEGRLIDGQHRLLAIIESGKSIEMAIARNVSPSALKTIDTGTARTFSDALKFGNYTNTAVTAAVVRTIVLWDKEPPIRNLKGGGGSGHAQAALSHSALLKRYQSDVAGFRMAADRGSDARRHTGNMVSAATAGTAFYLFARVNYDDAQTFIERFITGANLGTRHPILVLRERLIRAQAVDGRLHPSEKLALMIRAWNFYRKNEPVDTLVVAGAQGLTNKNFPVPK